MFAPAATPGEITSKLNTEVVRIVHLPEVRERLVGMGVNVLGNTPQEMADRIRREIAKFRPVAKAGNIKAE
jgi:tripartite-type tricarboxylate transporter receptor subunit TctC